MPTTDPLVLLTATVVGVLGIARATRLITSDAYPPSVWARAMWVNLTRAGAWSELAECPFCTAPYLTAGSMAWAWFTDLNWTWWVFHVWLAVSYLAAMIVVRDEPPEEG